MTHAGRIPVTFAGEVVGTARVHPNGSIDITLDPDHNAITEAIIDMARVGSLSEISIGAVLIPAVNALDAEKAYPIPTALQMAHYDNGGRRFSH